MSQKTKKFLCKYLLNRICLKICTTFDRWNVKTNVNLFDFFMHMNPYVQLCLNPARDRFILYHKKNAFAFVVRMFEVDYPSLCGYDNFWNRFGEPRNKPFHTSVRYWMMDEINIHIKGRAPDVFRKGTHHDTPP